ncbi:MAG: glycosyltransferase family 2 protein [Clostridia bacterium]
MEEYFDIPIVLFVFKRSDTTVRIIERLGKIKPMKLYIIGDAGRNSEEQKLVEDCRKRILNAINWKCEVIKNFASNNRGVYGQIALGAKWIFEQEDEAIFLEDDNLPELTFFEYCKECLKKYKENEEIFWICGTNYLQKCAPRNNASVFKSKHLMPCGWASWKSKFLKYYDFEFSKANNVGWEKEFKTKYKNARLFNQQRRTIAAEIMRKKNGKRYASWDFQTAFSIRMNDLWGIVPKYNQIENIGVDDCSTHGGNSMQLEMTKRFCGIKTYKLEIPLVLPESDQLSSEFEDEIERIILFPVKASIILDLREKLNLPDDVRLRNALKYMICKHKKGK